MLVSGTIKENLLMGNPAATDEELREALHTAVADFVYTLPQGIDTLCGERNSGLSEGRCNVLLLLGHCYVQEIFCFWMNLPLPWIMKRKTCYWNALLS